ncbi:hypothetical protein ACMBCM_05490, partial [Spiroplasma sp. K1]
MQLWIKQRSTLWKGKIQEGKLNIYIYIYIYIYLWISKVQTKFNTWLLEMEAKLVTKLVKCTNTLCSTFFQ